MLLAFHIQLSGFLVIELKDANIFSLIVIVALSVGIAFFAYFLVIHFVVEANLSKDFREVAVLDFYQQPHHGDIFFIGSSQVYESIDSFLIEESLRKRNINRSAYTIGLSGDTPLARVPELENLIASEPKMVVIGISYRDLTNRSLVNEDRFVIISDRVSCSEECELVLSNTQSRLMSQTPFEKKIYERKFILNSLLERLVRINPIEERIRYNITTNFKASLNPRSTQTDEIKVNSLRNVKNDSPLFEEVNPQKRALQYIITKLRKNNISVIILNLPIDPHLSDVVNESTRYNFEYFLNSTGVPWYNYEREYPSDYFADTLHMNSVGRKVFSENLSYVIEYHLMYEK